MREYEEQSFTGIQLAEREIRGAVFRECVFTGCEAQRVRFIGCEFHSCAFERCTVLALSLIHI